MKPSILNSIFIVVCFFAMTTTASATITWEPALKKQPTNIAIQLHPPVAPKKKSKVVIKKKQQPETITKKLENLYNSNPSIQKLVGFPAFAQTSPIPRIAVWEGKVNQHINLEKGTWETDSDGSSGAELDKLTYCQKFYPSTTSVSPYQTETITTWRDGGNTGGPYTNSIQTYECVQPVVIMKPVAPVKTVTPQVRSGQDPWCDQFTDGKPRIKVLSPNGGEVYTRGETVNLNWVSCNIEPSEKLILNIAYYSQEGVTPRRPGVIVVGAQNGNSVVLNTGSVLIKADSDFFDSWSYGKKFKIYIEKYSNYTGGGYVNEMASDFSDDTFTIKEKEVDLDPTPRISVWSGKVNQHTDANGNWLTDPDGDSGAELDKGDYCKKWYPATNTAVPYKIEEITTWREGGNRGGPYTSSQQSYKCIYTERDNVVSTDLTPRIAYWSGKVNQHIDTTTGKWISDPDQKSGADINKATYCQKWYPTTNNFESYNLENITTWRTSASFGNAGPFTQKAQTFKCVKKSIDTDQKSILVISPNGGETYTVGDTVHYIWETTGIHENTFTQLAGSDQRITDSQVPPMAGYESANRFATIVSRAGNKIRYKYSYKIPENFNNNLPSRYQGVFGGKNYSFEASVNKDQNAPITDFSTIIRDKSDGLYTIIPKNTVSSDPKWDALCADGKPHIQVISPNGGEVYNSGQKIKVKWKSCNFSREGTVYISSVYFNANYPLGLVILNSPYINVKNTGEAELLLPSDYFFTLQPGRVVKYEYTKSFKIDLSPTDENGFGFFGDQSDDTFTIQKSNDTTCTNSPAILANNIVVGKKYMICTVGRTDFTAVGASANTVGTIFTATGPGSGTGTVVYISGLKSDTPTSTNNLDLSLINLDILGEIKRGDTGDEVCMIQKALKTLGYKGIIASTPCTYGPRTVRAVNRFQKDNDLPRTGRIDQDTLDAMMDALDGEQG